MRNLIFTTGMMLAIFFFTQFDTKTLLAVLARRGPGWFSRD